MPGKTMRALLLGRHGARAKRLYQCGFGAAISFWGVGCKYENVAQIQCAAQHDILFGASEHCQTNISEIISAACLTGVG